MLKCQRCGRKVRTRYQRTAVSLAVASHHAPARQITLPPGSIVCSPRCWRAVLRSGRSEGQRIAERPAVLIRTDGSPVFV